MILFLTVAYQNHICFDCIYLATLLTNFLTTATYYLQSRITSFFHWFWWLVGNAVFTYAGSLNKVKLGILSKSATKTTVSASMLVAAGEWIYCCLILYCISWSRNQNKYHKLTYDLNSPGLLVILRLSRSLVNNSIKLDCSITVKLLVTLAFIPTKAWVFIGDFIGSQAVRRKTHHVIRNPITQNLRYSASTYLVNLYT